MSKTCLIIPLLCLCLTLPVSGDELFKVTIDSRDDAEKLKSLGTEPVLLVRDGYLVLADSRQGKELSESGLKIELLAGDVDKETLALDNRRDEKNVDHYPLLYSEDGLRLFRVESTDKMITEDGSSLVPIRNENMEVRFRETLSFNKSAVFQVEDLLELIAKVDQDSVWEYLHHLQAFNGRVAGTASNRSARDWLQNQLQSYGYTTAWLDPFYASVYGGWKQCYNVVAYKEGTRFPDRQIVVGAHFDAVVGSPGADDNGTGSVGVLEIARALADVETDMSFVFILFDAEEYGLHGAWHYANDAAASGDNIVCMLNMDMIGHLTNSHQAEVKFGPVWAYAQLWTELSDSLVNITGTLAGSASNSDHHAFVQNGYDVLFAAEYNFSTVYHTPHDSTTYVNFDYCTRMIKATLATAYSINLAPLPVRVTSVRDVGDGQSLQVNWAADAPGDIDYYRIFYHAEPDGALDSIIVPGNESSLIISGLTEGQEYRFYVLGMNPEGYSSIAYTADLGTPYSLPAVPEDYQAMPQVRAIRLDWVANNSELDFSHYSIIRDGEMLPYLVHDVYYIDNDYSLGSDFHDYLIVAVDAEGNISDTTGLEPVSMRAATMQPGRILAVNRSSSSSPYMVNEVVTGEFMRDALDGYDFDYLSDTSAAGGDDTATLNLVDMLDYEVVVLGGEAARTDDFGKGAAFGGILDTLGYYLSIGGKVILFGRFGDITTNSDFADTIVFGSTGDNHGYKTYFHMDRRVQYLSSFTPSVINSDLVGAHSQAVGYPDLVWDSLATVDHSSPWVEVGGIPCPSFGLLAGGEPEILYTYDSRGNFPLTEGKPVAWRYAGADYQYAFFEVPLSFMNRPIAKTVLQLSLSEMLSSGPAAVCVIEPDTIDQSNNPPAQMTIYLGNFSDGHTASEVNQASVRINSVLSPQSVSVQPSHPDFTGEVLEIIVPTADFLEAYGSIIGTIDKVYLVSWEYSGEAPVRTVYGQVTLIGESYIDGDANGDWAVNVADAVYLINYIFKGGPAPEPLEAGDANCDGSVNVGDAVYIISYVFGGGPAPECE